MDELIKNIASGHADQAAILEFRKKLSDLPASEQEALLEKLGVQMQSAAVSGSPDEQLYLRIIENIRAVEEREGRSNVISLFTSPMRWAVAAVLLLMAGTMTYFLLRSSSNNTQLTASSVITAPVKNKATLILPGGKQILLDEAGTGSLAALGAAEAVKSADGTIAYQSSAATVEWHTITNPVGSKPIQLLLADGTAVWLNTASSITFPTIFNGNERSVTLTGEAFFEVKHNAAQPFRLHAAGQLIEDVGTSFNVNAYPDEPVIKTTLIDGAIRQGTLLLKPGDQSWVYKENGRLEKRKEVDTDAAVAWKNGAFNFDHGDIVSVMRSLKRWYDVEIRYEGKVNTSLTFSGDISKSLSLPRLLKELERKDVHFRIEYNRTIVVTP